MTAADHRDADPRTARSGPGAGRRRADPTTQRSTTHDATAHDPASEDADLTRTSPGISSDGAQPALFALPPEAHRPRCRVLLLTGPSGCGKTSLIRRLGVPTISLDDFYLDGDHPDLPRRYGIVDWDDPASWDRHAALAALAQIAATGKATLPVYDIPTNSRTATTSFDADGSPLVVAEGIFAAELVDACRGRGILADALFISRPRLQTFWFRLLRDLGESRKPPLTLLRRGIGLARHEGDLTRTFRARGARAASIAQAERRIRELAATG